MKFDVITLAPELFNLYRETGIIGRAVKNNLIDIQAHQLRDYSHDKHKHVDDYPYSGGPGMLIKADVMANAIRGVISDNLSGLSKVVSCEANCDVGAKFDAITSCDADLHVHSADKKAVIFMTPKGRKFNQNIARELSTYDNLIIIVGAFEGLDQRAIDKFVDMEISMGDFVTTSGDLPAMTMIDSVARLLPSVLGSDDSSIDESHSNNLLEYPQYTRPEIFEDMKVPEILLSGDHAKIAAWKELKSIEITEELRPDMIENIDVVELKERKRKLTKILNRKK